MIDRVKKGISISVCILAISGSVTMAQGLLSPSIRLEETHPVLSWISQSGYRYEILSKSNLSDDWTILSTVTATADRSQFEDMEPPEVSRFYSILDKGPIPETEPPGTALLIHMADALPAELISSFEIGVQVASEAIAAASQAVGGNSLVVTGSITQNPDGSLTYSPEPTDRLVVNRVGFPVMELQVRTFNTVTGIYDWNQKIGDINLDIQYRTGVQQDSAEISGQYISPDFPDLPLNLEITLALSGFSESSGTSGSHFLRDTTIAGQIDGPGFTYNPAARQRFEMVIVSNNSSSTNETWISGQLSVGQNQYTWVDVKKQKAFRDGQENEVDTYWNASGKILLNGLPFGEYRKFVQLLAPNVGELRFQILAQNQIIDVEKWIID